MSGNRSFRSRVKRGAKHLDRLMPGWARKVRIRDLSMKRGLYSGKGDCGCILAQLDADDGTGEWTRGAKSILGVDWISDPLVQAEGFTLHDGELAWGMLDDLWKDEIRARR